MMATNMKRWTVVFRALANENRLKIIERLANGDRISVTDLSEHLHISFKATSNHLALLKNLDVVEARGANGHVFYSLNQQPSEDFKKVLAIFIRS
jgi:DNA-binding transcriptional ArsR family regulator